jgi:hypothetical protein
MKPNLSILVAAVTLAALACNSFVALPGTGLQTGPSQTYSIEESLPAGSSATQAEFVLAPGTASLALAGGASGLAEGQIGYNVAEWLPALSVGDGVLRIEQGLPGTNVASVPKDAINQWEVALGDGLTNVAIECPAGVYTLTLADSLPDGSEIAVHAGAVMLRLVVPAEVAASVEVRRGPTGVETEGAWAVNGSTYTTDGSGPAWNIRLEVGVGSLTLVAE